MMPWTETLKPWVEASPGHQTWRSWWYSCPDQWTPAGGAPLPTSAASLVPAWSQRVDKAEGGGPQLPHRAQVTSKVAPELLMPVHTPPGRSACTCPWRRSWELGWGSNEITLARLPLQKERKPCSLGILTTQSMIPLYCFSALICLLACWTCSRERGGEGGRWGGTREGREKRAGEQGLCFLISLFKKYGEIKSLSKLRS